jgi:HAD superfamily hydrolase (TIGR01509 family)
MAPSIRGILFDLGDTLLDFGQIDAPALFRDGAELAYEYLQELDQPLPPFRQYHRGQLRSVRWHVLKSRVTRREFNSLDLMWRSARRLGQRLSPDQMLEVAWRWYLPLGRQAIVEEGLRDVLAGLRDSGLTLGIVSNTFVPAQVLDRHLDREGLLELFPVRVYSCDVGYRKPNRRIFAAALHRLALPARETLFVGDSPGADIHGANRMGMVSVLKDPASRHRNGRCRPRHRIARLGELPRIVAEHDRGASGGNTGP